MKKENCHINVCPNYEIRCTGNCISVKPEECGIRALVEKTYTAKSVIDSERNLLRERDELKRALRFAVTLYLCTIGGTDTADGSSIMVPNSAIDNMTMIVMNGAEKRYIKEQL